MLHRLQPLPSAVHATVASKSDATAGMARASLRCRSISASVPRVLGPRLRRGSASFDETPLRLRDVRVPWDTFMARIGLRYAGATKPVSLSGAMEALTPQIRTMYEEHALGWV